MKDILKMTAIERNRYFQSNDVRLLMKQVIEFKCDELDICDRNEFNTLFKKSQKLMLGNNKSMERLNIDSIQILLLTSLSVLLCLGHYEKFIKWSDKL